MEPTNLVVGAIALGFFAWVVVTKIIPGNSALSGLVDKVKDKIKK